MGPVSLGWYFSTLGLALAAVQVLFVDRVERWLGARNALCAVFFLMGGSVALMSAAWAPWVAYAAIAPFALGTGMIEPMLQSLISRSACEEGAGPRAGHPRQRRLARPRAAAARCRSDRRARCHQLGVYAAAGVAGVGGLLAAWLMVPKPEGAFPQAEGEEEDAFDENGDLTGSGTRAEEPEESTALA